MAQKHRETTWPSAERKNHRQLRYHHWVRLFKIIAQLQTAYFRTPADLSSTLHISHRSLQRDIALIRSLGVKIGASPSRYHLIGPRW